MEENKMVMLPVPEYLVTSVYGFIAKEEERRKNALGETLNGLAQIPDEEWSEEDLQDVLKNGTRAMKVAIPHLAKHPDQMIKGQDLAEVVYGPGAKMQQLGGALGSFTRTAKTKYGHSKWPFKAFHDNGAWEYRMDMKTANKVRKLLGE